mmetsp:Transcript_4467/g.28441  ORF Transcript_4467/g.28441 Transcript_4467/m.28441 type:complete len:238 (+) Transcript_4467:2569-3282(+)
MPCCKPSGGRAVTWVLSSTPQGRSSRSWDASKMSSEPAEKACTPRRWNRSSNNIPLCAERRCLGSRTPTTGKWSPQQSNSNQEKNGTGRRSGMRKPRKRHPAALLPTEGMPAGKSSKPSVETGGCRVSSFQGSSGAEGKASLPTASAKSSSQGFRKSCSRFKNKTHAPMMQNTKSGGCFLGARCKPQWTMLLFLSWRKPCTVSTLNTSQPILVQALNGCMKHFLTRPCVCACAMQCF